MEEHHGRLLGRGDLLERVARDRVAVAPRLPVLEDDAPVRVAVAELTEDAEDAFVVASRAERTAEPWLRVDVEDLADRALGVADIGADAVVG